MKICKPIFKTEQKKETFVPYASMGGTKKMTRTYDIITSIEGIECIGETPIKVDIVLYNNKRRKIEWIYDVNKKEAYGLIMGEYRVGQALD